MHMETKTLLDRSNLLCTRDDLTKLQDVLNKGDVIESCGRGRLKAKWSLFKLKIANVCCFTQRRIHALEGKNLPKLLVKNHIINCLTYEENTGPIYSNNLCLFYAPALHLNGDQWLEGKNQYLKSLIKRIDGFSPSQFKGVDINEVSVDEVMLTPNILLYDNDIVEGNIIRELARQNVHEYVKTI